MRRLAVCVLALIAVSACKKTETASATDTTSTVASEAPQAASTITPAPGPDIPFVVANAQTGHPAFADFAWREFVALNWPAAIDATTKLPVRGQADKALKFSDETSRLRVWETWKADWEVVGTANPSTPPNPTPWADWKVNGGVNLCDKDPSTAEATHVILVAATPGQMIRGINQAQAGPLIDQNLNYVRYETRLNQNEYETILTKQWYLLSKQPNPVSLDMSTEGKYGAIELKISWRELAPGETGEGFYVVPGKIVDPGPNPVCRDVKLAMLGMHISHKSSPHSQWVWSTFEHINNVPDGAPQPGVKYSLNDGDPNNQNLPQGFSWKGPPPFPAHLDPTQPLPPIGDPQRQKIQVGRVMAIDPQIRTVNDHYRASSPVKGTVFENYVLVGNQWPTDPKSFKLPPQGKYPNDAGKPFPTAGVANTTMETYLQGLPADNKKNSCMSCHYGFGARKDFSFVLAGAWSPPDITEAVGARPMFHLSPELQSLQDDLRK